MALPCSAWTRTPALSSGRELADRASKLGEDSRVVEPSAWPFVWLVEAAAECAAGCTTASLAGEA